MVQSVYQGSREGSQEVGEFLAKGFLGMLVCTVVPG